MKITADSMDHYQKADEILKSIGDENFIKDVEAEYSSIGLYVRKPIYADNIELPNTLKVADVDISFPSNGEKKRQIKLQARIVPTGEWIYFLFSVCSTIPFIHIRAKEVYHAKI